MKKTTIDVVRLVADTGRVLRKRTAEGGVIVSRLVFIGANDSVENWEEVIESDLSDEEKQQLSE